MDPQINLAEIKAAWRALSGGSGEGWRTIPVAAELNLLIRAGRRLPGNEESVLVCFTAEAMPNSVTLPSGMGLSVEKISLGTGPSVWIALSRQEPVTPELFSVMVEDILGSGIFHSRADEAAVQKAFLSRIMIWQDFVERGFSPPLNAEAEKGLFAELIVLRELLISGMQPARTVDAWRWPLEGRHHFEIGTGAIDICHTTSSVGFPVEIQSLEQLDGSDLDALILAGVRLSQDAAGQTLPGLIHELEVLLEGHPAVMAELMSKVHRTGFKMDFAAQYFHGFIVLKTFVYFVEAGFPRLTRENVPLEIKRVKYEMDLDLVKTENTGFIKALIRLGVL